VAKVRQSNFDGEFLHFNAVRGRITGSGTLLMNFQSLDAVNTDNVVSLTMATPSAIEPTQLANFISQRGALRIRTNVSGEYFNISKIIVYVRAVASSYPA
jgi:hypothetical protein